MTAEPIILVVDDEPRSQETIRRVLDDDFTVLTASSADEALEVLEAEMVHAILCDQRMPGRTGVEFLREVRERWPDPVRIIVSGYTESEDIIAGLNDAGIYRYVTKPWEPDELLGTVEEAVRLYTLQHEASSATQVEAKPDPERLSRAARERRREAGAASDFDRITHAIDSPMRDAIAEARKIAAYDISVLVTGESGTGKELMARAIHYSSPRADQPFVIENCGALPDQLLESELFGCKKGAFTGAYEDRIGLFEQATGGTIFLDEIGETSAAFQVKLLRVLQEGEIRPLGARLTRRVNVRVIAATNRDLEEEVRQCRFRRDLYYRLAAFPIHLPPLRERPSDVRLLADLMLDQSAALFGKRMDGFDAATLHRMAAYDWPGNVRELHNEVQRMVALAEESWLGPDLLSPRVGTPEIAAASVAVRPGVPLKQQVDTLEQAVIAEALQRHQGNISRVSEELGLSRVGLRGKIQRFGLDRANGGPQDDG